jgi:cytoskeletal protein RodZ
MPWTSYLPDSPESLTRLEWRLWIWAGVFTVITVLLGLTARGVAQYKARILEQRLTKALEERDTKAKELEKLATEAKREVAEIREQQQARTLTNEQKGQFVKFLAQGPKGKLYLLGATIGDAEAQAFAVELSKLFQAAGWPIESFAYNWVSTWTPTGIALIVRNQEKAPPYIVTVQRTFEAVGFKAQVFLDPGQPEGALAIIVGRKT